jgi:ABC-2 type transport system ATP-binding protein
MIMRIYHPDPGPGVIRVLGEANSAAAKDRVGYLPEERGLYKKMTVREVLRFYAELKGRRDAVVLVPPWLYKMGLADWADKRVESLSKGMAQKVQFISAVIARPELVILDEPFSGLDPVNADVLREAVLELCKTGTTVIFSTHDMSVAEKMRDFIFMIYRGNKVLDGTLESIQDRYGSDTIRVRVEDNGFDPQTIPGVEKVTDLGRLQELRMAANTDPQAVLAELMKWDVHFELTRPSLHDIFVRIASPDAADMMQPAAKGATAHA